jgi:hypothetical protein
MITEIKDGSYSRIVIDSLTALENHPALLIEAEKLDTRVTQKKVRFIEHEEWLRIPNMVLPEISYTESEKGGI